MDTTTLPGAVNNNLIVLMVREQIIDGRSVLSTPSIYNHKPLQVKMMIFTNRAFKNEMIKFKSPVFFQLVS